MSIIKKNVQAFQDFCKSLKTKFSIICRMETWVNDCNINQNSLFQLEEYNAVHKIRKSRKGGGLKYLHVIHFFTIYART